MTDLMIDLETLATSFDCVIITLGAVRFNRQDNDIVSELYLRIDPEQDRKTSQETLDWWETKESKAEAFSSEGRITLSEALDRLTEFAKDAERVWSQGANFDIPVLENAYNQLNKEIPWNYWNVRDTRTMYDLCHKIFPKNDHNALEDAKQQASNIQFVFRALKKQLPPFEISHLPEDVVNQYRIAKRRREPRVKVRDLCFLAIGKEMNWDKKHVSKLNIEDVAEFDLVELDDWLTVRKDLLKTKAMPEGFDSNKLFFSYNDERVTNFNDIHIKAMFGRITEDLGL